MHFTEVGGVTLHYTLDGHMAGFPIIFIHSLGTELRIWDEVSRHFEAQFKVVRYDLRGHGLSDCPSGPYTIQNHVDDLTNLINSLRIETAILIGISVGGQIAMSYTSANPERVKALVLADTGTTIGTAQSWAERITLLQEQGIIQLGETLVARWFTLAFAIHHPADYRGYYLMLTRTPLAGYLATCAALRDADLSTVARMITAKTLVLCGTEDISTPPAVGRALAAAIPNAQFCLIEGAAHLPCVEKSDQVVTEIKAFLRENDAA